MKIKEEPMENDNGVHGDERCIDGALWARPRPGHSASLCQFPTPIPNRCRSQPVRLDADYREGQSVDGLS